MRNISSLVGRIGASNRPVGTDSSRKDEPPEPTRCERCGTAVPFQRIDRLGSVYWHWPGDFCSSCLEIVKEERRQRDLQKRIKEARIPVEYQPMSLERVAFQHPAQSFGQFLEFIDGKNPPVFGVTTWNRPRYELIREWKVGGPSLYLWGPTGAGKSTLAALLGLKLLSEGVSVLWYSESDYYTDCWSKDLGTALRRRSETVDVFILDELGARESLREGHRDELQDLLVRRSGRNMIITSNRSFADDWMVARYGDRVISRLMGACKRTQLALRGYDWRSSRPHEEENQTGKPRSTR